MMEFSSIPAPGSSQVLRHQPETLRKQGEQQGAPQPSDPESEDD